MRSPMLVRIEREDSRRAWRTAIIDLMSYLALVAILTALLAG